MPSAMDLTGQQFGKLTVIRYVGSRLSGAHKRRFYLCECECGGKKECLGESLKSGGVTSCGCLRWKAGTENPKWSGYGEISGNYWDHVKRGAVTRNLQFDLSIEEAWQLFLEQDRKCAISGIELSFSPTERLRKKFGTASLDRIVSSAGYIKGNVQWVHKDVNRMKQHFDEDYFVEMCRLIAAHRK